MPNDLLLWVAFNIFVLAMLALDLGVFHRRARKIEIKEALVWSGVWISLALLFNLVIYLWRGEETALEFLAGYLIEKSLSVDNIFVFLLIFSYFAVSPLYQHKVLFWGILGALVMRAIFIAVGVTLIEQFHWIIYVFGAFLVLTGIRMGWKREKQVHPERSPVLRLFQKFMPVTPEYRGDRFFVRHGRTVAATPLFLVLVVIESTDVIFAVDSIPAVLAVTSDPFIVYTSNVFAILGLRALYFALAGLMQLFHYLSYGLAAILVFVGARMLLSSVYKVPIGVALGVIAVILLVSVLVSLARPLTTEPSSEPERSPADHQDDGVKPSTSETADPTQDGPTQPT